MRMTDIVSSFDMTIFPILGFFVFVSLFAVLTLRAVRSDPKDTRRAASIPLRHDSTNTKDHGASRSR